MREQARAEGSAGAAVEPARRLEASPWQWVRARSTDVSPWLLDGALALVVFAIGAYQLVAPMGPGQRGSAGAGGYPSSPWTHLLLLGLAALALVPRARWPLVTLAGVVVFGSPFWVAEPRQLPLLPMVLIALASATASPQLSRSQAWAIAAAAALLLGVALVSGGRPGVEPIQSGILMSLGAAILLGDGARSRRALVVEAERRAIDAERSREDHALRRVSEERLQIARELHDVVAHNIALINVQAGVSAHLRERDPERTQEAFEIIKRVSHATLEEMRALVGVLRAPVEGDSVSPTTGLEGLSGLIASIREAGVEVALEVVGEQRTLPSTVDLSAYRLLQEGLTNAVRHGDRSSIGVTLEYGERALQLEVRNAVVLVPAPGPRIGGHGLEGMRERVSALGGRFESGRQPGGPFVVRATLPYQFGADA